LQTNPKQAMNMAKEFLPCSERCGVKNGIHELAQGFF